MIVRAANREGVDPALVEAIIAVESNFKPRAISRKGAVGLMQLMPGTASRYGVSDRFDPHENLTGGIRYLHDLLRQFRGDLLRVLAAYNAGENAVLTYGGIPPYRETREYVQKVLARYQPPQEPASPASSASSGRDANDGAPVGDESREQFGSPGVRDDAPSPAFRETDSPSVTELRAAAGRRPLVALVRGPLTHTRQAPVISVTIRHVEPMLDRR